MATRELKRLKLTAMTNKLTVLQQLRPETTGYTKTIIYRFSQA